MQIIEELKNLETQYKIFSDEVVKIKHEHKLMMENIEKTKKLIIKSENDRKTHCKAVELLTIVQGVTRDKIKDGFENIVSWGLKYIFQEDYKFCLVFGRRGNLNELDFAIKSPDLDEAINPMDSRGGGILNVVSMVLRLVLMEVSTPKINGFMILDESFKNVNGQQYINQLNQFVLDINEKFNRQIIHITDMENFKSDSNYNLIEIKNSQEKGKLTDEQEKTFKEKINDESDNGLKKDRILEIKKWYGIDSA